MIEIKNLVKKYPRKILFDNLNLKIKDGEFLVLMGKSGAGKSTLLNLIGGLDSQYNGEITINKINIKKRKNLLRDEISYLFQNYALIDNETVEQNLLLAIYYKRKINKNKIIENALKQVGLEGLKKEKIYNLSGGEQQRVALARIIIKDSNIILADEPTGNLDRDNADKVLNILKDINQKGKTIIMVTHDDRLEKFGTRELLI